MTRGKRQPIPEPATSDHDEEPEAPVSSPTHPQESDDQVPLHELVSGRRAGKLLHKILELHDFQSPNDLGPLVEEQLEAHGYDPDEWSETVTHSLQQAIDAPWTDAPPRLRLADIPRNKRLDELEFYFSVQGGFDSTSNLVTTTTIKDAFTETTGPGVPPNYADELGKLQFLPLRGFMNGFIDLTFEHEGRWYIADHKSNKLGDTYQAYHPSALVEAMAARHYILQYHIYTVALHRYLALRLPDYRYDDHFGGVYYLYLRGMSPEQPPGHGVFYDKPPLALVQRLDRMFEGVRS